MGRPHRHLCIPWGFVCLALGAGVILGILFPAGLLVFLLAAIMVLIGVLIIR